MKRTKRWIMGCLLASIATCNLIAMEGLSKEDRSEIATKIAEIRCMQRRKMNYYMGFSTPERIRNITNILDHNNISHPDEITYEWLDELEKNNRHHAMIR